jgi:catechol 2,3-dioxygenase-like lactoylglutathione lyase family enzyme
MNCPSQMRNAKTGTWLAAVVMACWQQADAQGLPAPLPMPKFHHLQLNSVDPDAAIAFYVKEFPSTSKTVWEGMPALASPNNVLIVFNKVTSTPDADPNATAYWHFGWNVTDSRKGLDIFRAQNLLAPFYTDEQGNFAGISSDTYPYPPGVPGRTRAQVGEARAQNLQPTHVAGNGYILGADRAIIEFTGNAPAERLDHVHMWQDDPVCAQLWYMKHLNASPRRQPAEANPPPSEANCKLPRGPEPSWPSLTRQGTYRSPAGGVSFGDVAMNWYPDQGGRPLAPSPGHLIDHVGLGVPDLNAWINKLKSEGVTFLRQPYKIGDARAVMVEGPSHEAIELVEVK